jgi:hypothetical protein
LPVFKASGIGVLATCTSSRPRSPPCSVRKVALDSALHRLGCHGFPLRYEFHFAALALQPVDAALQHLLAAAVRDAFQELAVGRLESPSLKPVHAHELFGSRIIGSDLFVRDRPLLEVERTEAEAVPRPAKGDRPPRARSWPCAGRSPTA